jgi:hypothetical protein
MDLHGAGVPNEPGEGGGGGSKGGTKQGLAEFCQLELDVPSVDLRSHAACMGEMSSTRHLALVARPSNLKQGQQWAKKKPSIRPIFGSLALALGCCATHRHPI